MVLLVSMVNQLPLPLKPLQCQCEVAGVGYGCGECVAVAVGIYFHPIVYGGEGTACVLD